MKGQKGTTGEKVIITICSVSAQQISIIAMFCSLEHFVCWLVHAGNQRNEGRSWSKRFERTQGTEGDAGGKCRH